VFHGPSEWSEGLDDHCSYVWVQLQKTTNKRFRRKSIPPLPTQLITRHNHLPSNRLHFPNRKLLKLKSPLIRIKPHPISMLNQQFLLIPHPPLQNRSPRNRIEREILFRHVLLFLAVSFVILATWHFPHRLLPACLGGGERHDGIRVIQLG
jgi:hypothetical protein